MNTHQLQRIIEEGENESVEFKRCGNPSGKHPIEATEEVDGTTLLALKLAERKSGVRTSELVDAGISRRTAQRIISELVGEEQLVPHGNGRRRTYHRPSSNSGQ